MIEDLINIEKSEDEINLLNPLVWAYVGDSIYELFIRTHFVNTTSLKVHELHVHTVKFVKAAKQAQILKLLDKDLTDEEKDIVRRTRNTDNHHIPKNATPAEYAYATAFEGLIGYLFLTKQEERLKVILDKSLEIGIQINQA